MEACGRVMMMMVVAVVVVLCQETLLDGHSSGTHGPAGHDMAAARRATPSRSSGGNGHPFGKTVGGGSLRGRADSCRLQTMLGGD